MYQAIINSNNNHERIYNGTSKSAIKVATDLGRCEGGEVARIYSKAAVCFPKRGGRTRTAAVITAAPSERRNPQ